MEKITQNYLKIHFLVNSEAPKLFRFQFRELWRKCEFEDWENGINAGILFTQGIGNVLFKQCQKIQKKGLTSGNIDLWDLPLLLDAITCLQEHICKQPNQPDTSITLIDSKDVETMKQIRNKLAHLGSTELDDQQFSTDWEIYTKLLRKFGLTDEKVDEILNLKMVATEQEKDKAVNPNLEKFKEFNKKGNFEFKEGRLWPAIKFFTEALQLSEISNQDLATVYSNRSAAYLVVEFIDEAKDDARSAITLQPLWDKGYFRLGKVAEKQEKYEKAISQFKLSLSLNPQNEKSHDGLSFCKRELHDQKIQRHMDPSAIAFTDADLNKNLKKFGLHNLPFSNETTKLNFMEEQPVSICQEGHRHLYGKHGRKKDYQLAAQCFSKAASMGNAEGIFNLALLTEQGKGVERNFKESHQLLLQAAEMQSSIELVPGSGYEALNLGVREAQHSLGLRYQEGIFVPKSFKEAHKWYTLALEHGASDSANNLGIMYNCGGHGINVDHSMGKWYQKLGAYLGNVRAIENVAYTYLSFGKKLKAQEWFTYAIKNGSLSFPLEKKKFGMERPLKEFSIQAFEAALKQELENSPLSETLAKATKLSYLPPNIKLPKVNQIVIDPTVKGAEILRHRQSFTQTREMNKMAQLKKSTETPTLHPPIAVNLIGLKPVTLKEMDQKLKDKVYSGYAMQVRVIEDAIFGFNSISLLVKDENGDLCRVFVYNYPQVPATHNEIGYGCVFTIVHPYYRLMKDEMYAIRVDDSNLLMKSAPLRYLTMCRYCHKNGAKLACRECRRAMYCSKDCRYKDANGLDHKSVCFKKI